MHVHESTHSRDKRLPLTLSSLRKLAANWMAAYQGASFLIVDYDSSYFCSKQELGQITMDCGDRQHTAADFDLHCPVLKIATKISSIDACIPLVPSLLVSHLSFLRLFCLRGLWLFSFRSLPSIPMIDGPRSRQSRYSKRRQNGCVH